MKEYHYKVTDDEGVPLGYFLTKAGAIRWLNSEYPTAERGNQTEQTKLLPSIITITRERYSGLRRETHERPKQTHLSHQIMVG